MADGIGCLCDAKSAGECVCTDVDWTTQEVYDLRKKVSDLQSHLDEADKWVQDLQSGMYINCVYCGHRYGPKDKVHCTMADALKQHIEKCDKHPMSKLKSRLDLAVETLEPFDKAYETYDYNVKIGGVETRHMIKPVKTLAYQKVRDTLTKLKESQ